jgi:hypothetical protein
MAGSHFSQKAWGQRHSLLTYPGNPGKGKLSFYNLIKPGGGEVLVDPPFLITRLPEELRVFLFIHI